MERVNEIGVKKVLGSTQIHLIVQFFTESMVINLASFALAIIMLLLVQQPFENWLGKDVIGCFLSWNSVYHAGVYGNFNWQRIGGIVSCNTLIVV